MSISATQKQFYDYCTNNEFLDSPTIEEFKQRLQAEGNVNTVAFSLEKFVTETCPNCRASGAFKWHFLGKLQHPHCRASWYVSPGIYISKQLRATFTAGRDFAGQSSSKSKGIEGFFLGLIGFLLGVGFRIPITIAIIPIQAVVSLSQSKSAQPALEKQSYRKEENAPELSYEVVAAVEQFVINYVQNNNNEAAKRLYQAMLAEAGNQYDQAINQLDAVLCSQPPPDLALIGYRLLSRVIWLKFNFGNRDGQTISDEEVKWCDRANKAANKAVSLYESVISKTNHPIELRNLYFICKSGVEMTLLYCVTKKDAYGNVSFRDEKTLNQIKLTPLRCVD
jgi:tetratricopeptide (TPR) repeat protein